jgi:hypothetical protein
VILEFTGLPGAGKTTVERQVVERLVSHGVDLIERQSIIGRYIRERYCGSYRPDFVLRRPITAIYRAGIWRRHFGWRLGTGVLHDITNPVGYWLTEDVHLVRFCREKMADAFGGLREVWNFSEGFSHHLASTIALLHEPAARFTRFAPYDRGTARRWVVVHVDVPFEIALDRLSRRGRPASWRRDPRGNGPILRAFEDSIPRALELASQSDVRIERIDLSDDHDAAAPMIGALSDRLANILTAGSP